MRAVIFTATASATCRGAVPAAGRPRPPLLGVSCPAARPGPPGCATPITRPGGGPAASHTSPSAHGPTVQARASGPPAHRRPAPPGWRVPADAARPERGAWPRAARAQISAALGARCTRPPPADGGTRRAAGTDPSNTASARRRDMSVVGKGRHTRYTRPLRVSRATNPRPATVAARARGSPRAPWMPAAGRGSLAAPPRAHYRCSTRRTPGGGHHGRSPQPTAPPPRTRTAGTRAHTTGSPLRSARASRMPNRSASHSASTRPCSSPNAAVARSCAM